MNAPTNSNNIQNNTILRKISSRIIQIYNDLIDFNNDSQDAYQKKKIKDEHS